MGLELTTIVVMGTDVVSANLDQGEVYNIIFVSDLRQVSGFPGRSVGFFPGTPVSSTNKTDHHNITEILLKVALNTINPKNLVIKLY
jgi:hypothetical protein